MICLEYLQASLQKLSPIISASNHIRHFGAVALELAIFASGRVDLFVDLREKLRVTDVAAGYLIALEAGGVIVDKNANPLDSGLGYDQRISFIAAASQEILNETLEKLNLPN
ncbi:inositol monophosphatase family protein [Candidatus Nitrosotalea sp. TS]|uniref:inositol monophosphatase family protein n=1 Tax=Candidatus Nitrosotalea sp. TS TaxID=2341020 RepID=UPI002A4E15F1|nr:inositol monophosphatase family protein [Candidatus Nitrosotalea sp. TS]